MNILTTLWYPLNESVKFKQIKTSQNKSTESFSVGIVENSSFYYQTPYHIEHNLPMTKFSDSVITPFVTIASYIENNTTYVVIYYCSSDGITTGLKATYSGQSEILTFTTIFSNIKPEGTITPTGLECSNDGFCIIMLTQSVIYILYPLTTITFATYYGIGIDYNIVSWNQCYSIENNNIVENTFSIVVFKDNTYNVMYVMSTYDLTNENVGYKKSGIAYIGDTYTKTLNNMCAIQIENEYHTYIVYNNNNSNINYSKMTNTQITNSIIPDTKNINSNIVSNYITLIDHVDDRVLLFTNKQSKYYYSFKHIDQNINVNNYGLNTTFSNISCSQNGITYYITFEGIGLYCM